MPRLSIPSEERSKTSTYSAYDEEKAALGRLVLRLNLHTPFDVFRLAVWESRHPAIARERDKGNFRKPRFASARTMKIRKSAA